MKGDKGAQLRKKSLRYYRLLRLKKTSYTKILGLTGTPIQNRIGDLASIFLFLGCYISRMTDKRDLQKLILTHMFRRNVSNLTDMTKAIINFPNEPYNEIKVIVKYETEEEENFYLAAAGDLCGRLKIAINHYKNIVSEDNVLVLLTMLRLLSSHPNAFIDCYNRRYCKEKIKERKKKKAEKEKNRKKKYNKKYKNSSESSNESESSEDTSPEPIPEWTGTVSKLNMIEKQLLKYYKEKESCIVFVHFYEEARQIYNLKTGYRNKELLNGQTQLTDRDYIVHESKRIIEKGGTYLIIANIIACGEGLNLQHFHNILIVSVDWNPYAEEQAIGRVYRIGCTRRVNVTRYYHKPIENIKDISNIDKYMKNKQDMKRQIAEELIDRMPNAAWTFSITQIPEYDVPCATFPKLVNDLFGNRKQITKPPTKSIQKRFSSSSEDHLSEDEKEKVLPHKKEVLPQTRKERADMIAEATMKRLSNS